MFASYCWLLPYSGKMITDLKSCLRLDTLRKRPNLRVNVCNFSVNLNDWFIEYSFLYSHTIRAGFTAKSNFEIKMVFIQPLQEKQCTYWYTALHLTFKLNILHIKHLYLTLEKKYILLNDNVNPVFYNIQHMKIILKIMYIEGIFFRLNLN